jgi:molybdopterin converting factor small subunit
MVKVLYFGAAREITGIDYEGIDADDTVSLRLRLLDKYPGMKTLPFRLALNSTLLKEDASLKESDKIAVLPPFAGG